MIENNVKKIFTLWHYWQVQIFFCGVLLSLGHREYPFWPISFLIIPLIFNRIYACSGPKRAAMMGWWLGFGYFGFGLYWVGEAFLVDPKAYGWMMPFAVFLLAGGLALFWALAFFSAGFFIKKYKLSALLSCLIIVLFWSFFEWLRSIVLTGFPWLLIGYIWHGTAVFQNLSWLGIYGLTLITFLLAGIISLKKKSIIIMVLIAFMGMWIAGNHRLSLVNQQDETNISVRLIQPNIPQNLKHSEDQAEDILQKLLDLSSQNKNHPDLIIWPESAVPYLIQDVPRVQQKIADLGVSVLLGAVRYEWENNKRIWYNSLVEISKKNGMVPLYDKIHLVPFGEYIPLIESVGFVGSGFSFGSKNNIISLDDIPKFRSLICYEAIFAHEIHNQKDQFDWMLQITNDAWFGKSVGPFQHFTQARARAIEQGVPLIRVANTGISAIVNAYGQIISSLPLGSEGVINGTIPAGIKGNTLYSHYEDRIFYGVFLGIIVAFVILFRFR